MSSARNVAHFELDNPAVHLQQKGSSPFAFSPGDLVQLIDPKNILLLEQYNGLKGILKGLHGDPKNGLKSEEEKEALKPVSIEELTSDTSGPTSRDPGIKNEDAAGGNATHFEHLTPPSEGSPFWQRKRVFGENVLPVIKPRSIFHLMWVALQEQILILLIIAAVVSLGLGLYEDFGANKDVDEPKIRWVEGVAIIVAIIIVVLVGSLNDWQKERQFQKLNAKKEDREVRATRDGKELLINVREILVGDVLHLEPGDIIAADGVLINGHNLRCDESAATGESDAVRKVKFEDLEKDLAILKDRRQGDAVPHTKSDPFIVSGSKVLEGVGMYIVTGVGVYSFHGKTMMGLRTEPEDTPLQAKLNGLAESIAKLGGAAALLMFIVLIIKYFVGFKDGTPRVAEAFEDLTKIVISTVTVVVVAVPEGLPLAVTLALAYATTQMLKDNNLVRVLAACETMGSATTVCSDKTGTLTQNKMTVVAGTIGLDTSFVRDLDAHEQAMKNQPPENGTPQNPVVLKQLSASLPQSVVQLLNQSIAVNTTAFEGGVAPDGTILFNGSKTETALLSFMLDLNNVDYKRLRARARIEQLFPFSSERKAMGVVVKMSNGKSEPHDRGPPGGSKWRFLIKGASEVLLRKSSTVVNVSASSDDIVTDEGGLADEEALADGIAFTALTTDRSNQLQDIIMNYAGQSLRTIGLAYRDFEQWPPEGTLVNSEGEVAFEELAEGLTFISVVGIEDPLRDGVRAAVANCQRAGVYVRMVTGDNILTAKAIATQCGIYTNGGLVMEGPVFRNLTEQQLNEMVPRLQVLARSSPEDKRRLVAKLKEQGQVVAVTGDGTNDGPALKTADVGFSMGIAGTEVAKEASSIILMDDNFASIVRAIMWGRSVNDAVKKFLQFQLTVNVTAVLLTFVSAVASSSQESVLTAVQLLWVNLIMDTFAALALATDPPTEELLNRLPEPRDAPLINFEMWKMILGQSLFQLTVTMVLLYAGNDILDYTEEAEREDLHTIVFNVFVFLQIFNEVNCRRLDSGLNIFKGILKNKFFVLIFIIMCGGQFLIVHFGDQAFQVVQLDGVQWAISVGVGFLSIPVGVVIRLIPSELFSWMQKGDRPRRRPALPAGTFTSVFSDVQHDLSVFKSLRGGRLRARAAYYLHKHDNKSNHSPVAAATLGASLLATSVGVGWASTSSRINEEIELQQRDSQQQGVTTADHDVGESIEIRTE